MRELLSSHGRNVKTLTFGDQMSFRPSVSLQVAQTRRRGGHGLLLLNYLILTTHCCPTQGISFQSVDSKLSIALQNMVDAAGEIAYEVKVE